MNDNQPQKFSTDPYDPKLFGATEADVRDVLLAAGYRRYENGMPGQCAAFLLAEGGGITVSLHLEMPPATTAGRREVFAGYMTALIRAGFHADYRGRYLYVHDSETRQESKKG